MKNLFLSFVLLSLIISGFGQTAYIIRDTVPRILVKDNRIYQLIDGVCEKEKNRPYFTDSTCSIFMDIYFYDDSSYAKLDKGFIVDVYFRETVEEYFLGKSKRGVFQYKNHNVFVAMHDDSLPMRVYFKTTRKGSKYTDKFNHSKAFPPRYKMFKSSDNLPLPLYFEYNPILLYDIICSFQYQFYVSRYKYVNGEFILKKYFPLEISTF